MPDIQPNAGAAAPNTNDGIDYIQTLDGSISAFNRSYGQGYHSRAGAWLETKTLYGKYALLFLQYNRCQPVLTDVGFGLGYNFLLACLIAKRMHRRHNVKSHILSFDRTYPFDSTYHNLSAEYFCSQKTSDRNNQSKHFQLTYPNSLLPVFSCLPNYQDLLQNNGHISYSHDFGSISCHQHDFRQSLEVISNNSVHIWFWDPFSAAANPEMWTVDIFRHALAKSQANSMLITYAANPYIRYALHKAGWLVFRAKGIGNKHEATIACPRNIHGNWLFFLRQNSRLKPFDYQRLPLWELTPLRDYLGITTPDAILHSKRQRKNAIKKRLKKSLSPLNPNHFKRPATF